MSNAVRVPARDLSHFSPALRARFSVVPTVNIPTNTAVPAALLNAEEEAQLKQALSQLRDYAVSKRQTDEKAPVCFISFVHGEHDKLVEKIADYLEFAGVTVYADIGGRHEKLKLDRASYMQKAVLEKCDFVVVIGTPEYLQTYKEITGKQK